MKQANKLATTLAFLAVFATGGAQATILDFEAFPLGDLGTNVLVLPEATVTGFGSSLFNSSNFFGAGQGGSICALNVSNCQADMQIEFVSAVTGLLFQTMFYDPGDSVTISAYDGLNLVGSTVVTSDTLVDFSALTSVTRLFFDDSSIGGAGFEYGVFNFTAANTNETPEPGVLALMLLGVVGLGFSRRQRKIKNKA